MNATAHHPHRRIAICVAMLATVLLPCSLLKAQEAAEAINGEELNLEFTFTPAVWLTRLNGTAMLGPSPAAGNLNLELDFNLDEYKPAPGAQFEILKRDLWRLEFSGYHFSTDSDGVFAGSGAFGDLTFSDGDVFDTSLEITTIGAEFGIWLWQPYCLGPLPDGSDCRVSVRAGPLLGVRHIDLDHSLTVAGEGAETAGGEWLAPYGGLQLEVRYHLPDSFPLVRWMEIDAGAGFGPALGGDGGVLIQLQTGITLFFNDSLGVGMGYRLLHLNVENDDYEFDGGLQGLIFTATIRF